MQGISKSQVSRLCQEWDEEVTRFRQRALEGQHPYIWLDATFVKVRQEGKGVSMAVVIATRVRETGDREVLGFAIGPREDRAFWMHFLWLRNALALVPQSAQQMVAAMIRTVFIQPDAASTYEHWRKVRETFITRYPRLAQLMERSEEEVLAYLAFPDEHWRQIWSNNP